MVPKEGLEPTQHLIADGF